MSDQGGGPGRLGIGAAEEDTVGPTRGLVLGREPPARDPGDVLLPAGRRAPLARVLPVDVLPRELGHPSGGEAFGQLPCEPHQVVSRPGDLMPARL